MKSIADRIFISKRQIRKLRYLYGGGGYHFYVQDSSKYLVKKVGRDKYQVLSQSEYTND